MIVGKILENATYSFGYNAQSGPMATSSPRA